MTLSDDVSPAMLEEEDIDCNAMQQGQQREQPRRSSQSIVLPNIRAKRHEERPQTPLDLKKSISCRTLKVLPFDRMLPRKPISLECRYHEGLNETQLDFDLHKISKRFQHKHPDAQDFNKDLPRPDPARDINAPVYNPRWEKVRMKTGIGIPDFDKALFRPSPETWQGGTESLVDIDRSLSRACPALSGVHPVKGFEMAKMTARPPILQTTQVITDPEAEQILIAQEMRKKLDYPLLRPGLKETVRFATQVSRDKAAAVAGVGRPPLTSNCTVQFVPVANIDPQCSRPRDGVGSPIFHRTAPRAAYDRSKTGKGRPSPGSLQDSNGRGGRYRLSPTPVVGTGTSSPSPFSSSFVPTASTAADGKKVRVDVEKRVVLPPIDMQKYEGWTNKVVPARERASECPFEFKRTLAQSESRPNLRAMSELSCQMRALRKTRSYAIL
uniref:Uncharacterized protein n=1 Tax=Chromera velia CCMP2878 TaxID=1169474 RepID=A0A0G4I9L7_9ALVE|eukprot:Cvel_12203.t1-p1 / transcript=Cvel_12203.t1 / gene=Cvel_12203 / organism=Chromera_velia_CCMP2878 / gene_product=hypothetical protein / transcript_product=hypothetical protein / location=Cvel_scaffold789:12098-13414(-) / protein_length=439 / sequence_SO=supercontig / SO=protein_coding / is_pseudo=false